MKAISVLINGATGRMGQETLKALSEDDNFIVLGTSNHQDNLAEKIRSLKPEVVVDFTTPSVVFENTMIILKEGARPVIGTTGLTLEQVEELQVFAKECKTGGIIAPNFSIGGILMMRCAKEIAAYFNEVEIIELHHPAKKDAPSGTAVKTAQLIAKVQKPKEILNHNEARGKLIENIPVHSIRLSGLLAHQKVIFGSEGETLTIAHDTLTRSCFMPGVKLACKTAVKCNELIYGLENIL